MAGMAAAASTKTAAEDVVTAFSLER
jgi:hypothetical protein